MTFKLNPNMYKITFARVNFTKLVCIWIRNSYGITTSALPFDPTQQSTYIRIIYIHIYIHTYS